MQSLKKRNSEKCYDKYMVIVTKDGFILYHHTRASEKSCVNHHFCHFYLCITLFCVCLSVLIPDQTVFTDKLWTTAGEIFSARVNFRPSLFHVYLQWLLWCKWRVSFVMFSEQFLFTLRDHAKITTYYLPLKCL